MGYVLISSNADLFSACITDRCLLKRLPHFQMLWAKVVGNKGKLRRNGKLYSAITTCGR